MCVWGGGVVGRCRRRKGLRTELARLLRDTARLSLTPLPAASLPAAQAGRLHSRSPELDALPIACSFMCSSQPSAVLLYPLPKRTMSPPPLPNASAHNTNSDSSRMYATLAARLVVMHAQPQALQARAPQQEARSEPQHDAAMLKGTVRRAPILESMDSRKISPPFLSTYSSK